MKTKVKKKVAMCLATVTCVTTLAVGGGGTALAVESPFTDVKSSDWFSPAVSAMAEGGLVAGVGNNRFSPNENMSIAAFSTIMCRAMGLDTSSSNSYWGYGAVQKSIEAGYIANHGAITPAVYDQPISREEAIAGMTKLKGITKESPWTWTLADIPDGASISPQYQEAVVKAYNMAICTGVDKDGTFVPKSNLTRAQVAQLFFNVDITEAREIGWADRPVSEMSSSGYMAPTGYVFSPSIWDTYQKATYSDGNTYTAEYVAFLKEKAANGPRVEGNNKYLEKGVYEVPVVLDFTLDKIGEDGSVTHVKVTPEVDVDDNGNWVPVGEYVFDCYGKGEKVSGVINFTLPWSVFVSPKNSQNTDPNPSGFLQTVRLRIDDCYSANDGWVYAFNGSSEKGPMLFSGQGTVFDRAHGEHTLDNYGAHSLPQ